MARDFAYALKRLGYTWLMALAVIGGFITILGFGPDIEPAVYPVLTNQTSRVLSVRNGQIEFDMRFYKARPCKIADADWVMQQGERATFVTVRRSDGAVVGANSTYSVGWLTIGPFYVETPVGFDNPDVVYAIVYYDCHPGWLTRQILGPVRLQ